MSAIYSQMDLSTEINVAKCSQPINLDRVCEYWLLSLKFEIFKFWKFFTVKSWRENNQIKIPELKKASKIKNLMDWVQKQVLQNRKIF